MASTEPENEARATVRKRLTQSPGLAPASKPGRSIATVSVRPRDAGSRPAMTGTVLRLKPGATQELHWHPNANEWFYVSRGQVKATLFGANKKLATAELASGDCGYFPMGWGHSIEALGTEAAEVVSTLDSGAYQASSPSEWIAKVPRHLLENNPTTPSAVFEQFPKGRTAVSAGS